MDRLRNFPFMTIVCVTLLCVIGPSIAHAFLTLQPFQKAFQFTLPDTGFTKSVTFQVPARQTLLIEFASVAITEKDFPENVPEIYIETEVGNTTAKHYVTLKKVGHLGGSPDLDYFTGSQAMQVYAGPGTTVTIVTSLNLPPGPIAFTPNTGADITLSISGELGILSLFQY